MLKVYFLIFHNISSHELQDLIHHFIYLLTLMMTFSGYDVIWKEMMYVNKPMRSLNGTAK